MHLSRSDYSRMVIGTAISSSIAPLPLLVRLRQLLLQAIVFRAGHHACLMPLDR
jgi:hypothetical protein